MSLPLEQQVCSLELSKKLKELGVKQESLFYWKERRGIGAEYTSDFGDPELRISPHHVSSLIAMEPDRKPDGQFTRTFSAFTVAELGEMLSLSVWTKKNIDGKWQGWKPEAGMFTPESLKAWTSETEADARAKMLINLIEQGIVKVEKC